RKGNRSSLPLRLENGDDHFGGGPGVVHAAFGLSILLDSFQKILDRRQVSAGVAFDVEWFRLPDSGGADGLPVLAAAAGGPGGILEEIGGPQVAGLKLDDAAGSHDRQSEA